jgi:anhydro-N-acetylmuramic acid kinase
MLAGLGTATMAALFIGLMSGTSLDGIDGVLVELGGHGSPPPRAHVHLPFDAALRASLLALNDNGGVDELHRAALAANALTAAYAYVAAALCRQAGVGAADVRAIGAHGQTVRHRPGADALGGYTTQLLNGALLAERTGIDVVCDFRSRDLAAGGQGAPLVPAFHAEQFARPGVDVAVLNVGGIANLSLLPARGGDVRGFDTGPGNGLMDHWVRHHRGESFDADGAWAAGAEVDPALLQDLRSEPYFDLPPPKSTGRDLFHPGWLQQRLDRHPGLDPQAVQATLLALTIGTIADALRRHAPSTERLRVCGGGAFNGALMRSLRAALPGVDVASTTVDGVPPDQVEAFAFAWLASAFVEGRPGNLAAVTGARGQRRLGALHPAH